MMRRVQLPARKRSYGRGADELRPTVIEPGFMRTGDAARR